MLRMLAAMTALFVLAVAPAARGAETWTRYNYPEAGFSAEFPGKPTFERGPDTDFTTDRQTYVVEGETAGFVVKSARATTTLVLADLKRVVLAASRMEGRTLVSQKTVTLEGETGLESVIRARDGSRILHIIYFHDGRLLQFMVAVGADDDLETLGRRFARSIRFDALPI